MKAREQGVREDEARPVKDKGNLVAILQGVQDEKGYLPEDTLRSVAASTGRSLSEVYGVATFYKSFSLTPRGVHAICVCMGTACHVRGAGKVAGALEKELGIKAGETTADGQFSLETVNCLGACALGPIVTVDGEVYSKVRPEDVAQILSGVGQAGKAAAPTEAAPGPAMDLVCPLCGCELRDRGGDRALNAVRLRGSLDGKNTWLEVSCVHGDRALSCEGSAREQGVVECACPCCGQSLRDDQECPECGTPMFMLTVRARGTVHICPNVECGARSLDLDTSPEVAATSLDAGADR